MATKKSVLVTDMSYCIVCGNPNREIHHVFFGAKRPISDKFGYILPLCYEHHRTGRDSPHQNRFTDLKYKRMAQIHFEKVHGTRQDFIRVFGKSYL